MAKGARTFERNVAIISAAWSVVKDLPPKEIDIRNSPGGKAFERKAVIGEVEVCQIVDGVVPEPGGSTIHVRHARHGLVASIQTYANQRADILSLKVSTMPDWAPQLIHEANRLASLMATGPAPGTALN